MRQNIFVLGATGSVGGELIRQIAENGHPDLERHTNPTAVVGMANSKEFSLNPGGFKREALLQFAETRQQIHELGPAIGLDHANSDLTGILNYVKRQGMDGDIVFVDATAGREALRDFHLDVIRSTRNRIVTANKNPLALYDHATYAKLTNDPNRYGYSATTMAGLGAVPWVSKRNDIGDNIHRMKASLSGTLGFIADQLKQEIPLSTAIKYAKQRGFTEPDFRDDLNGLDVARKLIILAREAGYPVELEDIKLERFLPDSFFETEDADACLHEIETNLDQVMAERFKEAANEGKTLKYLASFELKDGQPKLKVGFETVSLSEPFGQLAGTANRIEVVTDIYDEAGPYELAGPGAGLRHTASVLRTDLLDMQPFVDRTIHN